LYEIAAKTEVVSYPFDVKITSIKVMYLNFHRSFFILLLSITLPLALKSLTLRLLSSLC